MRSLCRVSLAALLCASCAHVATVSHTTPKVPAFGNQQPALVAAQARLNAGEAIERSNPSGALGSYLASAQAALAELGRHPEEKAARDVYNFSVARSVGVIEEAKLKPWDRTLVAPAPEGQYPLTGVRPQNPDRNPANFELI